jgi:hypothetical protein
LSLRYRKNEDVIARQIAGETLLVPIRGDLAGMQRIFALDKVAEYIWQQLDAETTLEAIRDGVLANFDVSMEQAEADIGGFIAELLEAGLIVEGS